MAHGYAADEVYQSPIGLSKAIPAGSGLLPVPFSFGTKFPDDGRRPFPQVEVIGLRDAVQRDLARFEDHDMGGPRVCGDVGAGGKNRDRLFFLDHLLPGSEKSRFIRVVETKAEEQFGVYGLVTLDGRLGLREGYLPSRTVLSCYCIPFCEEIRKKDRRKRPFPILDHK